MSVQADLRALAFGVAYRMLGSVAEAEDVVQEALLRLHGAEGVENAEAYLTTVTTRLAIDVLRSARVRREAYPGSWLPEPLVDDRAAAQVEDEETISLAFLLMLEQLTPEERAVLVLREAFDYRFAEIGEILGKSPDNCRQIMSRARRALVTERPRFDPDPVERRRLAATFLAAAREGDMAGLVALLAPDATLVGDGGGKARAVAAPMVGAAKVARALVAFARIADGWGAAIEPVRVNGQPGLRAIAPDGRLISVMSLDVEGGRVRRVLGVVNPDKLGHLGPLSDLALR